MSTPTDRYIANQAEMELCEIYKAHRDGVSEESIVNVLVRRRTAAEMAQMLVAIATKFSWKRP